MEAGFTLLASAAGILAAQDQGEASGGREKATRTRPGSWDACPPASVGTKGSRSQEIASGLVPDTY